MEARNKEKADFLYGYLDQSSFYGNKVDVACRSRMNVPFQLKTRPWTSCSWRSRKRPVCWLSRDIASSVACAPASTTPCPGRVKALVSFMDDFAKRHG